MEKNWKCCWIIKRAYFNAYDNNLFRYCPGETFFAGTIEEVEQECKKMNKELKSGDKWVHEYFHNNMCPCVKRGTSTIVEVPDHMVVPKVPKGKIKPIKMSFKQFMAKFPGTRFNPEVIKTVARENSIKIVDLHNVIDDAKLAGRL